MNDELKWTTEPPTESGWYWFTSDLTGNIIGELHAGFFHTRPIGIQRLRLWIDFDGARWAGPIPKPTD